MSTKAYIFTFAIFTAIMFTFSVWVVNYNETARMDLAIKNGYVQCFKDNIVMWKKDCSLE